MTPHEVRLETRKRQCVMRRIGQAHGFGADTIAALVALMETEVAMIALDPISVAARLVWENEMLTVYPLLLRDMTECADVHACMVQLRSWLRDETAAPK